LSSSAVVRIGFRRESRGGKGQGTMNDVAAQVVLVILKKCLRCDRKGGRKEEGVDFWHLVAIALARDLGSGGTLSNMERC